MIISASRRSDIPRFYSAWLMQRLHAGFCLVPNPYNSRQINRVDLRAEAVTAIVFWTRDPRPLFQHLDELEESGYRFYFQITFTNYPARYEKSAVAATHGIDFFQTLAKRIGPRRIVWRYDPIFFAAGLEPGFHLQNFAWLCDHLAGYADRVVISLLDEYRQVHNRLVKADCHYQGDPLQLPWLRSFLADFAGIAHTHGLPLFSCAETGDYADLGIEKGACIDQQLLNNVYQLNLPFRKDSAQRPSCQCQVSQDIGQYQSCPAGCLYCYATSRPDLAGANWHQHQPQGESLV
jgi:hypothetical protein